MCMPVCVGGLHGGNVQTLEIGNICKNIKGASFFTITRLGPLLSREEANGMYKENIAKKGKTHMYEMYWTRLEEKLFKEDVKRYSGEISCRVSRLLLSVDKSLSSGIKTPRLWEWFLTAPAEATTYWRHEQDWKGAEGERPRWAAFDKQQKIKWPLKR